MKTKHLLLFGAALCSLFAAVNPAFAQGTAFTYQGRLSAQGSPASGNYDLSFSLFGVSSNGIALAGALTNSATAVTGGLFTVTLDFGANFPGAPRWLEIGVRTNGSLGSYTTLAPCQALTATPYAIKAVSADTATTAGVANSVAAGAVGNAQLAAGAAAANLAASGQAGVASGGLVLSATENPALVNAGYVKIGSTTLNDNWSARTSVTPSARYSHTAVWTGSEMIVWGGYNGTVFNDGGRYNPAANTWTAMDTTTAPGARYFHTAVWTGSEMIVWGGNNGSYLNDGGRYNPVANTWTAVPTTGAPAARLFHTAVWTGSEMIVWGGNNGSPLNDGGRYNPASNIWTAVTSSGAPAGRYIHTAVWTGSEMIVWGGFGSSALNDGGRFKIGRAA